MGLGADFGEAQASRREEKLGVKSDREALDVDAVRLFLPETHHRLVHCTFSWAFPPPAIPRLYQILPDP